MQKEYFEVILEDINGKLDLVLEGHDSLRREMYGIRDILAEKIDHNSFKIDLLNKKIDGVEQRLDQKIDGVEQRLDQKIDGVEQRLDEKIDGVRTVLEAEIRAVGESLNAHRRDTEAHRGYQVREDN